MQQIAKETNFSETTFVLTDVMRDGGFDARIFTPGEEVDFAGHPTLGTAFLIREHMMKGAVDRIVLNLKVGQIPVDFPDGSHGVLWMHQKEPTFGKGVPAEGIAEALGLKIEDIDDRFPVQKVSTGSRSSSFP